MSAVRFVFCHRRKIPTFSSSGYRWCVLLPFQHISQSDAIYQTLQQIEVVLIEAAISNSVTSHLLFGCANQ